MEAITNDIGAMVKAQGAYLASHTVLETLLYMNTDEKVAQDVGFYYRQAHFGEPGDWAGADLVSEWFRRNMRIYSNIVRLIDSPNERVLVIYGAGHLGWLRQNFSSDPTIRLRKLAEGEFDAIVLAQAGLARLGRAGEATEVLDPLLMLPAPAQGALAVECREDDAELRDLLAALDDEYTRAAVTAERALLAELEAGCSAPIAALAEVAEGDDGPEIYLRGAVFSPDGGFALRLSRTGTLADAAEVGRALARDLREEGADNALGVQHDPHP